MSTTSRAAPDDDGDAASVVADLTEGELLALFVPLLPRSRAAIVPTGDDAAVIAAPDGRFVVSTDVLVENHHFRRGWGTARDVGARAAAQNLADIVAMGAVPTSMVVALAMPSTTPVAWVLDLARGLADVCAPLGVGVDGGDLSGGDQLVVAVTVHGDLQGRAPVLRSGARPGHVLAHAGALGRAAGGYAVLAARERSEMEAGDDAGSAVVGDRAAVGDRDDDTGELTGGATDAVVGSFLRPTPPYDAGPAAADAGASAMMDVSDGLLRDAGRMARASDVELALDPLSDSVPEDLAALTPLARRLGADPAGWLLTGGEDHGILAAFPPDVRLPAGFRRIGVAAEPGEAGPRVVPAAEDGGAEAAHGGGWDHFRRG